MKKLILSLYSIFIVFSLFGGTIERTIIWNNISPGKLPDFEVSIKTSEGSIPMYLENIKLDEEVLEFELVNPQYSLVSGTDIEIISKIEETLDFKYHVFRSGSDTYLQIEIIPFIKDADVLYRLESFTLKTKSDPLLLKSALVPASWKSSSVLSSGKWVKIKASQKGIYKIKYSDLQTWGFTNPSSISIKMEVTMIVYISIPQEVFHGNMIQGKRCLSISRIIIPMIVIIILLMQAQLNLFRKKQNLPEFRIKR